MSNHIEKALQGVMNTAGQSTAASAAARELMFRKFTYEKKVWDNHAAVAGTVAVGEHSIGSMKMPARLVEAKFLPDAATTGNGTHYHTLLVAARLAATPFTSRNLITYVASATTANMVQWDEKDLAAYFTATAANLDVAEGEIITVAVTKTGSDGLAFPAGTLELRFRPRDT
jgi:hypothetical protein